MKQVSIENLQVKDFAKWLRKQARDYGRNAVVSTNYTNAVEFWLQSLGFSDVSFQSGGEMYIGNEELYTGWVSLIHYMTDEDCNCIPSVSAWLEIIKCEDANEYLISR